MVKGIIEEKRIEVDEIFRDDSGDLIIKFRISIEGKTKYLLTPAAEIQSKIGIFLANE